MEQVPTVHSDGSIKSNLSDGVTKTRKGRRPWVTRKISVAFGRDEEIILDQLMQLAAARSSRNDVILQAIRELHTRLVPKR